MRWWQFLPMVLLLLAGCAEPEPAPTRPFLVATAEPGRVQDTYLPVWFHEFDGCEFVARKSLAWGGAQVPQSAADLCIAPGTPYLNWTSRPRSANRLEHVPMLWGARTDDFLRDVPEDYVGLAAGPNEGDRLDQAGRYWCIQTPVEVDCGDAPAGAAAVMLAVEAVRPGIRWVAPSWSNAASDCRYQINWWYEYLRQGGEAERVVAWGYHVYPDGRGMSAVEKVDECFENMRGAGLPERPLWVTEIGHTRCDEAGADELGRWVEELLADGRVELVAGYAPYTGPPFCPFFDGAGRLTAVGQAFREAGGGDD